MLCKTVCFFIAVETFVSEGIQGIQMQRQQLYTLPTVTKFKSTFNSYN